MSGPWIVFAAAAGVIIVLAGLGNLSSSQTIASLAAILIATWFARRIASTVSLSVVPPDVAVARSRDDLLETVIAALPDPTVALDRDGRVIAINPPAEISAPALRRGEPVSIALRVPEVVDAIRRAASSGKPERVEFAEHVPSERWSEAFVTPIKFSDGDASRPHRLLLTFHDLTAIRRMEEMRVDFVANASHELRTPLAALSGFIETLKGAAKNDVAARDRFLDIMEAQAKRMARLIDDLLSLSRIELSAHVPPVTPVPLMPIVRQVVDALQVLARDREVEVVVSAPPEPLTVTGDRDELTRVFENLIENALKYGASGQRVEVSLSRGGARNDEALVAVRDFGPGISAEHLPRLTERFYRVDVAGSRAQGGTGLGLALVKHIMNRHRGRITIESMAGKGATFTVRLPLRVEAK